MILFQGGMLPCILQGEDRYIPKPQFKMLRTSERCTVFTLGIKIFAVFAFEALRLLNEAVKNSSFSSVLCHLCF